MEKSTFLKTLETAGISEKEVQQWLALFLKQQDFFNPVNLNACLTYFQEKKTNLLTPLNEENTTSLSAASLLQEDEPTIIALFEGKNKPPLEEPSLGKNNSTRVSTIPNNDNTTKASIEEIQTVGISDFSADKKELRPFHAFASSQERYKILETLGEGGMGVVQRAQDNLLGREVALKKIKKASFQHIPKAEKLMLWRLQTEASITATLEHPNIVPLYDMEFEAQGQLLFTMRKIEGDTLNSMLKKKRKGLLALDENKTLSIFLKVCEAICYAHNKGVIHRDLKPDNIMVGEFGEVYVMDWGIAKKIDELQEGEEFLEKTHLLDNESVKEFRTLGGIGTPGYMPPEQKKDAAQVKPQADIYALGKMLRECFLLMSPNEEFRYLLDFYKSNKKPRGNIEDELNKKIPSDLIAIIEKATKNQPEQRYQKLDYMVEDLERYLKNVRVSVREYSLWETFQKWLQRNKQKVVITSIMFCFVFISIFFVIWKQKKIQEDLFSVAFEGALSREQQAKQVLGEGKTALTLKIKYLLESLNFLNSALMNKRGENQAEQKKLNIGEELIRLTCKTEDYNLACYVANELEKLSVLSTEKKELIKKRIEHEKNKTLLHHQERLDYWLVELKKPEVGSAVRQNAIFEISKMQEKEIFEQLLHVLEEATNYFLNSTNRTAKMDEYYLAVVSILGRLENIEARDPLLNALQKMAKKMIPLPIKVRPQANIHYMITLVHCLYNLKARNVAKTLHHIRYSLSEFDTFFEQTILPFNFFSKLDGLEKTSANTIIAFMERALVKSDQNDYQGAIEDCNEGLRLSPGVLHGTSIQLYLTRGLAKKSLGDLQGALKDFNILIQREFEVLQINDPNLTEILGAFYGNRAKVKEIQGKYEEALADFNRCFQLSPNPGILVNLGNIKGRLGMHKEAFKDLDEAIRLNPNFVVAYQNRGSLRMDLGDFTAAIADFNMILKLEPNNSKILIPLAISYLKQNKIETALELLNKSIKQNPQSYEGYKLRGKCKMKGGDLKGGIQDFDEALRLIVEKPYFGIRNQQLLSPQEKKIFDQDLIPQKVEILLERGQAHALLGKLEKAKNDFKKMSELQPENYEVYHWWARLVASTGDLKEAEKNIAKALLFFRKNPEPFSLPELGLVHFPKKFDFSNPKFKKREAILYRLQAKIRMIQQKFEEALVSLNKAVELNPENVEAYTDRSYVHFALRNFSLAIKDATKAILREPDNFTAYTNRGFSRYELGDREGGKKDMKKYLELTRNKRNIPIIREEWKLILEKFPGLDKE